MLATEPDLRAKHVVVDRGIPKADARQGRGNNLVPSPPSVFVADHVKFDRAIATTASRRTAPKCRRYGKFGSRQLRFNSTPFMLVMFRTEIVLNNGTSGTSSPKSVNPA